MSSTSPQSIVWWFDADKFQPGDILLSTSHGKGARAIRKFTDSKFSHASICFAPPVFLESMPKTGVRMFNIIGMAARSSENIRVLRLKNESPQLMSFVRTAHRYLARDYNIRGLAEFLPGLAETPNLNDAYFCSQLVAAIYEKAGLYIIDGLKARQIHPGHIEASNLFTDITGKVVTPVGCIPSLFTYIDLDRPKSIHDDEIKKEREIGETLLSMAKKDEILRIMLIFFEHDLENISTRKEGQVPYGMRDHPLHNIMYFIGFLWSNLDKKDRDAVVKFDKKCADKLLKSRYLDLPSLLKAESERRFSEITRLLSENSVDPEILAALCKQGAEHCARMAQEDEGWAETFRRWTEEGHLESRRLFARARLEGIERYTSDGHRYDQLMKLTNGRLPRGAAV